MHDPKILNTALSLALEFGRNLNQPVQARLQAEYPYLWKAQLDEYNQVASTAAAAGKSYVYKTLERLAVRRASISSRELKAGLEKFLRDKYPWINGRNIDHVYSQGVYYAYRDGLDKGLRD